jgi:hypothetical protein
MNANDPVREYCRRRGYADHVIHGGMRYLVESWETVVQSIVNGETQYQDDYLNDMDGRQILDEVLSVATSEQRKEFSTRIEIADQRFLAIVIPTRECLWGDGNAKKHGWTRAKQWWYFHRPPNVDSHEWRSY